VAVYETDGRFVRSFGEETLKCAWDITAVNDGRIMVVEMSDSCVHIFSEDGDYLDSLKLQGRYVYHSIAFRQASEHVVIAGTEQLRIGYDLLRVEIWTKDGEFVRSTQIPEETRTYCTNGMTLTKDGRIAVLLRKKVLVI